MHQRFGCSFAATAFVSLLLLAPPAVAQDDAAAERLYEVATAAMDKGDYATACPKLEEVVRLVPDGIGAKLTLAECYEGAGRLASAWAVYGTARAVAAKAGQPDREKKAAAKERALAGEARQKSPSSCLWRSARQRGSGWSATASLSARRTGALRCLSIRGNTGSRSMRRGDSAGSGCSIRRTERL
jgi:hypothetical protein